MHCVSPIASSRIGRDPWAVEVICVASARTPLKVVYKSAQRVPRDRMSWEHIERQPSLKSQSWVSTRALGGSFREIVVVLGDSKQRALVSGSCTSWASARMSSARLRQREASRIAGMTIEPELVSMGGDFEKTEGAPIATSASWETPP